MPIYVLRCDVCGNEREVLIPAKDRAKQICHSEPMRVIPQPVATSFKFADKSCIKRRR